MNKEHFFKELEKRLQILTEEERTDIINEYKDTLREKVKHGRSEKEAIEDFGSMDELVKNILSAYKINPDYGTETKEETVSFKEVGNSLNEFIKKCSMTVSNWFQELNEDFKENGQELTVEFITELVIKGILVLFILALATIPFSILRSLGSSILEMMFFPAHMILNVIWGFLVGILYFCVSVLIVIAMYKDCFPHHKEEKKVKKETKKQEAVTKTETKQVKKNKTGRGFSEIVMILVRIWIVLIVLVPLWFTLLGVTTLLVVLIYYTCQGVPLIGLDLLFLGILLGLAHLIKIIQDVTFHHKRLVFFPFIISIILMVIGGLLTFDLVMNIDFHKDELPSTEFKLQTYHTKLENVQGATDFYIFDHPFEVIEDASLKDGEVVVEFKYYKDYVTPYMHQHASSVEDNEHNYIQFYMDHRASTAKKMYHQFLKDLKNKKVYDYDLLNEIEDLKVYANQHTKGFVK